jgi:DNA repair exonuclease SbcCD ATPase subunit
MSILEGFSTEQLQSELEQRKNGIEKQKLPERVSKPVLDELEILCKNYLEAVASRQDIEDLKQYIFESAIESYYGKNVWSWVSGRH